MKLRDLNDERATADQDRETDYDEEDGFEPAWIHVDRVGVRSGLILVEP